MIRRVLAVVGLVLFLGAFAWLAGQAFHPDRARMERANRAGSERAGLVQPGLDRTGPLEPTADEPAAEPGP